MSNMFAVLGESDDEDRVKVAVKKDDKKKDAAPAKAAPAKAAAAAAPAPAAKAKGDKDTKDKKAPKDSKPREERPKSAPAPSAGDDEVAVKNPAGDRRPRGRGDRGGRGGRGDRAAAEAAGEGKTRVKREFDRRNTSGRSGEQRRGGRGPYSTGNAEQEAQDAEKGVLPEGEEVIADAAAEPEAEAEPVVEEPQAPPQKTFDDFLRAREESRANSDIFGSVKVREVTADFSNLSTAEKGEITFVGGNATGPAKKVVQKERKTRNLIADVGFTSAPVANIGDDERDYKPSSAPAGGRGAGRGGRGAGRGGRGARDGARPSSGARGPNFGDEASFPSL